jgi:NAD dependent epimerase/dehydratase
MIDSKQIRLALVTGADGFIGSHLVEYLVAEGFNVRALVQYNSFNSWGWLDGHDLGQSVEIISGDIRDSNFCNRITQDVDVVFHLAALIAIPYSYLAPDSYIDTNVKGTLNICQAAVTNGVKRVLHTSTSEVYGTAKYVPIDEDHPLQPQSPYSASKIAADALAMSFYNSFDCPITVVRPFNTYGPRQSARAVIPTIISQIASGSKEIKVGDLSPTRDFNYVSDTCRGFYKIATSENTIGHTLNIGSNTEISIEGTMNLIKKIMSSDIKFIVDEQRKRPKKSEVQRLWCDNSKIKEMTGFVPAVNIEDGLKKTVEWFMIESNLSNYKAGIYNV